MTCINFSDAYGIQQITDNGVCPLKQHVKGIVSYLIRQCHPMFRSHKPCKHYVSMVTAIVLHTVVGWEVIFVCVAASLMQHGPSKLDHCHGNIHGKQ